MLAAQWERLRSTGVAWVTAHLMGDPTAMTTSFVEVDCELRYRVQVGAALCAIPEVASVEESARNRDFVITLVTPGWAELTRIVLPEIAPIPGTSTRSTHHSAPSCAAWPGKARAPTAGRNRQLTGL